jgi:cellulose synthase/poly-beta-1,6-N-acetylglucosamine synthase-like glycosyltransferase
LRPRPAVEQRIAAMTAQAGPPFPAEIAFLARHGVDPFTLDAIAARAAALAMPADVVAIREGHIAEDAFHAALAAEIGAPLARELPRLAAGIDASLAINSGIAALAQPGRRYLLAPEGRMITPLLSASPSFRGSLLLMAPSRFRAAIRAGAGAQLARAAATGLERIHPGLSARQGPGHGQIGCLAALVFALAFFGTLEPALTLIIGGLLMGPLFLLLATFRIAATFEPESAATQRVRALSDAQLPVFTVLVPLFREVAVLDQLLAALLALDYPQAKLDVKLLVEADDGALHAALATRILPAFIEVLVVPPGQPRTKPRALNIGLAEARGALTTIFDAEDIPDPEQLRLAAGLLAAAPRRLACIQARLAIDNARDNILTRLFALEYAGLFDVVNPGLTRSGLPFLIGGTSNHFRTDVLREIGGWDSWNVTEDADLAIRLVRAGYRIGDCPSTTWEEAPVGIGGWMRQRRRWMKGFLQCVITHTRQPRRLVRETGPASALAFAALSLGTVTSALLYPPFLAVTLINISKPGWLSSQDGWEAAALALGFTLFLAGHLAIFAPPLLGALRRRDPGLIWALPLMPAYLMLMSLAAWWALIDLTWNPFHWHKTEHGLGRRPDRDACLTRASASPPPTFQEADRG